MTASRHPGERRFTEMRSDVRAREHEEWIAEMPDAELARMLLVKLWHRYDVAGMSYGRSEEARLLEAALRLSVEPERKRNVAEWPSEDRLVREARRRKGEHGKLVRR